MAILTTDIDPFLDGSLKSSHRLNSDLIAVIGTNGTWVGTSAFESSSLGQGISLSGANAVTVGSSTINSAAFSYFAVVKPTAQSADSRYIFDFQNGRGILSNGATGISSNVMIHDGSAWHDTGYLLAVGVETKLVLTSNGSTVKLYANSVEVFSSLISISAISGSYGVGTRFTGDSSFFLGMIDQPQIYNRVLIQTEIDSLQIMEEPPAEGLAVWFNGVETTQVFFNGIEVTEAHFNGTLLV